MPKSKPKLPGATVTNSLDFMPPPDFWSVVEKHTSKLTENEQAQLLYIVGSYYSLIQFELNAADLELAQKRLSEIKKAASTFQKVLCVRPDTDNAREANHYVEHEINRVLEDENRSFFLAPPSIPDDVIFITPRCCSDVLDREAEEYDEWVPRDWVSGRMRELSITQMTYAMSAFLAACNAAGERIKEHEGAQYYRPGESWEGLIYGLVAFFLDLGLEVTAAKHYSPDAPPSPFVTFVADLQSQFVEQFQRHTFSPAALTGKISKLIPGAKQAWRDAKRRRAGT